MTNDREIDEKDKKDIEKATDGKSLKVLVNSPLDAVDPDKKFEINVNRKAKHIEIDKIYGSSTFYDKFAF